MGVSGVLVKGVVLSHDGIARDYVYTAEEFSHIVDSVKRWHQHLPQSPYAIIPVGWPVLGYEGVIRAGKHDDLLKGDTAIYFFQSLGRFVVLAQYYTDHTDKMPFRTYTNLINPYGFAAQTMINVLEQVEAIVTEPSQMRFVEITIKNELIFGVTDEGNG